jgi:hypothetical protein
LTQELPYEIEDAEADIAELIETTEELREEFDKHKTIIDELIEFCIKTEAKANALAILLFKHNILNIQELEDETERQEEGLLKLYNA